MARRNDHNRNEIKEMAISAARTIIISEGLSACTARRVAKEIKYTVGTLYNIFENLDELIFHVNAETLVDMHGFIEGHMNIKMDDVGALKKLSALYIIFIEQNPHLWSAVSDHLPKKGMKKPDWYQEKIENLFALIEAALKRSVTIDEDKTEEYVRVIWSGLHGIYALKILDGREKSAAINTHLLVENFIDHYIGGIKASDNSA